MKELLELARSLELRAEREILPPVMILMAALALYRRAHRLSQFWLIKAAIARRISGVEASIIVRTGRYKLVQI